MKRIDDNRYIVGIEMGHKSTSIAYLNHDNCEPVIFDISGGYKDSSIPTVMQFIFTENVWLVGHEAKMNQDIEASFFVEDLVQLIEEEKALTVGEMTYTYELLISIFIKSLLIHFSHINPKAIIEKLILSVSQSCLNSLDKRLKAIEKELGLSLVLINHKQAIARYLQYSNLQGDKPIQILDYGYNALKHFECQSNNNQYYIKHIADYKQIACKKIEEKIRNLLIEGYQSETGNKILDTIAVNEIEQMLFVHYVWFFQKYLEKKPLKVFYSFAYPPFKKVISKEVMEEIMADIVKAYEAILSGMEHPLVLMGNGFRMPFTRFINKKDYKEYFHSDVIVKGAVVEGSASVLQLPSIQVKSEYVTDKAYGVMTKDHQFVEILQEGVPSKTESHQIPVIIQRTNEGDFSLDFGTSKNGVYERIEKRILQPSDDFTIKRVGLSVKIDQDGEVDLFVEPLRL